MSEMENEALNKALGQLTDIQRESVNWEDGPMLVLAGPGSGKTRVLTCRIARLLEESRTAKFRILGLTFTNKAADEMRERVAKLVPGLEQRIYLGTFHSFCASVLRDHGHHLGFQPDFRIYSTDEDLLAVLQDALAAAETRDIEVKSTDTAVLPVIRRLKSQLVSPEAAPAQMASDDLRLRIQTIYESYEASLRKLNALDFESLLYYSHQLFERFPAFAKRYQRTFPFWCVDEFQDTNLAQYKLLTAMAGGGFSNVFVVGDDDQIIYQWNGASHERIKQFQRDFEPAFIQLPVNYRCPSEIVTLANNLIQHNLLRTEDKEPIAAIKKPDEEIGNVIRAFRYSIDDEEAQKTAEDIVNRHPGELGRVAVLARTRRLLEGVQRHLTNLNVQSVIAQRRDNFASAPFVWLYACLRQSVRKNDRNVLEGLVGAFNVMTGLSIEDGDVATESESAHGDFLRGWAEHVAAQTDRDDVICICRSVSEHLVEGADFREYIKDSLEWFEILYKKDVDTEYEFTGFREDKAAWGELVSAIGAAHGRDCSKDIFLHELELRSKEATPGRNTVVLMTVHGAKGKEFDHVYVIGLAEDVMPSYFSRKNGDRSPEMEEERRNCFVAITRAERTLTISFADSYNGWRKNPSRFLKEMGFAS